MTTRSEIDLSASGPLVDDGSVPSGVGVTLALNATAALQHRVNRSGCVYMLGGVDGTDTDPPEDYIEPTQYESHGSVSDSPTRGLPIVTPPNGPVFLCLGEWPLSAHASSLRVVLGMEINESADEGFDVYAFAAFGTHPVPVAPSIIVEDFGVASFSPRVKAQASYRRVGGDTMPDGSNCKPVVLDIPIGTRPQTMARGIVDDGGQRVTVWVAMLSRQGTLFGTATVDYPEPRIAGVEFGKGVGATRYWLLRDGRTMHGALGVLEVSPDRTLIHPPAPSSGSWTTAAYYASMGIIWAATVTEVVSE